MNLCASWHTCSQVIDGALTVAAQTPHGLRSVAADAASTKHTGILQLYPNRHVCSGPKSLTLSSPFQEMYMIRRVHSWRGHFTFDARILRSIRKPQ